MNKYKNIIPQNPTFALSLFILWILLGWSWGMHQIPSFLLTITLPQTLMLYVYRFVTALIAVYVLFFVSKLKLNKKISWNMPLIELGKISLGIYVIHMILMPIINNTLSTLFLNKTINILLLFIVTLLISYLVCIILSKFKLTAKLLLGKI